MPRLPVKPRRPRNTKPLPLRERLRRIGRELVAGWWFFLGIAAYFVLLFYVAIDPLVMPLMPEHGKLKILGAYPASFALLKGNAVDGILFVLLWLPVTYLVLRFPFWLKGQREWERKAALRRARDKARRAERRAEREAAQAIHVTAVSDTEGMHAEVCDDAAMRLSSDTFPESNPQSHLRP